MHGALYINKIDFIEAKIYYILFFTRRTLIGYLISFTSINRFHITSDMTSSLLCLTADLLFSLTAFSRDTAKTLMIVYIFQRTIGTFALKSQARDQTKQFFIYNKRMIIDDVRPLKIHSVPRWNIFLLFEGSKYYKRIIWSSVSQR